MYKMHDAWGAIVQVAMALHLSVFAEGGAKTP
jgi:hypothetical protein